MRPREFRPVPRQDDERFVRDEASGTTWHRVFHRALYADTDRSGVVYHANFLRYFELGRTSLMRDVGYPYKEVEDAGTVYPVVELGLTFHRPLHYDSPMWIHSRPGLLERVRVTFDYVITRAESGELVVRGFTRHCALGPKGVPTAVDPITARCWESCPR
ncbi:MAG: acyl-CoA thioesterase [Deltaproteobacteria bacterium]|nr:acyl-CoA thioesterase [Deltaproteobacteria bacterium]